MNSFPIDHPTDIKYLLTNNTPLWSILTNIDRKIFYYL